MKLTGSMSTTHYYEANGGFVSFNTCNVFFFGARADILIRMREQVSRQVQTEMRKTFKKKKLPASYVLKRGQSQKAREKQEDARRERRTEPARFYPPRAPDSRKLTHTTQERNQDSRESGRSRT